LKNLFYSIFLLVLITIPAAGQDLTQTVRGTIIDADSRLPLIGAQVILIDSSPLKGSSSDVHGRFRLDHIPIGRISLRLSYLGYETVIIPNLIVNSGKEVILDLEMRLAAISMDELVVTQDMEKGAALNDMAIVSSRSISAEETNRYPGGFNDPSRILSNFAGVTNSQDGSTDIIVRSNSPKYLQWRLEGVPITNPSHFADQNAIGIGGLSTLNNNVLATSDFYTGAFTPEYGDALSGVYDVRLRSGNNETYEAVFGLGILGTDLTFEGPLKKGYGGSFLVNYRYSTISLIDQLGLIPDIGGVPKFQDATFKVVLPTEKLGRFSLFGLAGLSHLDFEDVTPTIWQTPGNRGQIPAIREDFNKDAHLLNLGLHHTITLNSSSYLKSTLAFSQEGITDRVFEIDTADSETVNESGRLLNFNSKIKKSATRAGITYHNRLNARNTFQTGSHFTLFDYNYRQSQLSDHSSGRVVLNDFQEQASTISNFFSWQFRPHQDITVVSGLHITNVLLNSQSTLEPRIAVNWRITPSGTFHAGYGNHSTMESIHHYFAQIEAEDGTITQPNQDLGLLRAHHFVAGYEQRLGTNMRGKIELYVQDLYNLPVENDETSSFATINEGLELRYFDLVNEGTGRNYGVEVTLERFFSNSYYFVLNGSLYNSAYTALDGMKRNTKFNGNYLANIIIGKEFNNLGKSNNQTLLINAKAFFGGAQKIIPLLRDSQGNLNIDPANNRFWDYDRAYEDGLDDIYAITLSASYKWNKPNTTHELFLDLINITGKEGRISEYYDESEPGSIGYITQPFFFPNMMYRVYF
jgi:hypothetical protein